MRWYKNIIIFCRHGQQAQAKIFKKFLKKVLTFETISIIIDIESEGHEMEWNLELKDLIEISSEEIYYNESEVENYDS